MKLDFLARRVLPFFFHLVYFCFYLVNRHLMFFQLIPYRFEGLGKLEFKIVRVELDLVVRLGFQFEPVYFSLDESEDDLLGFRVIKKIAFRGKDRVGFPLFPFIVDENPFDFPSLSWYLVYINHEIFEVVVEDPLLDVNVCLGLSNDVKRIDESAVSPGEAIKDKERGDEVSNHSEVNDGPKSW